jgi:hypothetical protein
MSIKFGMAIMQVRVTPFAFQFRALNNTKVMVVETSEVRESQGPNFIC